MLFSLYKSRSLVVRTVLFLALLGVTISIAGAWLIESRLLINGDFWIWGRKGKLVIILTLLLPFIIRERIHKIPQVKWKASYLIFGICSLLSLTGFFVFASQLIDSHPEIPVAYLIGAHALLLSTPVFLMLCVYGPTFIVKFLTVFKKEIIILIVVGTVLYIFTDWIWNLWPLFSGVVLRTVAVISALSFPTSVAPPEILTVGSFSVSVGEECSGLESLFMFSALYAMIGYLEKRTLQISKYIITYIPLAIGLYIVNILRVYILVLVGVLWSPMVAIRLFHTYLGMLLFVIYFLLFLKLVYPGLKK